MKLSSTGYTKKKRSNSSAVRELAKILRTQQNFLITGHRRPDGDLISCELLLASLLGHFKKRYSIVNRDKAPAVYSFLPGFNTIGVARRVNKKYDVLLALECGNSGRLGGIAQLDKFARIVNVDHHADYENFGTLNYIEPKASSTAELLWPLFRELKLTPNHDQLLYILTGMYTDTNGFKEANTTPESLRIAARIAERDIKPQIVDEMVYQRRPISSMRLLGRILCTFKLTCSGRVLWYVITRDMIKETGASDSEIGNFIDTVKAVNGSQVAIQFVEPSMPDGTRISIRTRGKVTANEIARHFGGGGHKRAAGCIYPSTPDKARRAVLSYVRKLYRTL